MLGRQDEVFSLNVSGVNKTSVHHGELEVVVGSDVVLTDAKLFTDIDIIKLFVGVEGQEAKLSIAKVRDGVD